MSCIVPFGALSSPQFTLNSQATLGRYMLLKEKRVGQWLHGGDLMTNPDLLSAFYTQHLLYAIACAHALIVGRTVLISTQIETLTQGAIINPEKV